MVCSRASLVLAVLIVLSACSGKKREFAEAAAGGSSVEIGGLTPDALTPDAMVPTDNGAGGAGEAIFTDPTLLPSAPTNEVPPGSIGAACSTNAECTTSGSCVDGVCCSSSCTELCAACNVPGSVGTCSAASSDDACGELQCAGIDTECRKLDTAQLALNCDGFAACKVNADCAVVVEAGGTTCQTGTGSCDGAGACLVAGKATLGEACIDDAGCAEGHCVAIDGGALICCDSACDSPCQACSPGGHCEQTPETDVRCEAVACPADDVCRDYTADVTASQCRAFGQCQAALDCPQLALRPDAECECDASTGVCRLRPGAACSGAEQCVSGVCTTNGEGTTVCCASACGEGLSCSGDGAACIACEGSGIECNGNTERRCNAGTIATTPCANGCTPGTGCNALPPLGFRCDAGQCSNPSVCQTDVTGAARCCSRNCATEGKVCAESGSCICQEGQVAAGNDCLLQDGDPCQNSQQCQTGSACTDGVCCQEACNGTCERCEPNSGLCVAIAAGQQDNQCSDGRQCTGARGDCRLGIRQPCTGNGAECTTNDCEPTVGNATQICCSQSCSGNRPFCRSNGQGCVQCETAADCGNGCNAQTGLCNDLLPIGTPCGASAQCASAALCLLDQSSQTRCCESNCAAQGLLCNGAGRCVSPAPATLATVVGGAPTAFPRTLVDSTSTTTRLWTVQNNGGSATRALTVNNNLEFPTSGNCIGLVLQPGASCSLNITFSPRQPGTRQATFTLSGGPGVAVSVGVEGQARLRDGAACPTPQSLCDSGRCTTWYADADGDGFGTEEFVGTFPSASTCGDGSTANRPPPFIFEGGCRGADVEIPYVLANATPGISNGGLDCCDRFFRCDSSGGSGVTPDKAFPGQTTPSVGGCDQDFDCDGVVEFVAYRQSGTLTNCTQPGCADRLNKVPCAMAPAASCAQNSGVQGPGSCGPLTDVGCGLSPAGVCQTRGAGQITMLCL